MRLNSQEESMNPHGGIRSLRILAVVFTVLIPLGSQPVGPLAQTTASVGKSFAQKLVEATRMKHDEADEIGISATTRHGCLGIASTDKADIGEKCEKDDVEAMQTGKPFEEKKKMASMFPCRCTIRRESSSAWLESGLRRRPVRRKRLSRNRLTKSPARWKCRFRRRRNYASAPMESDAALSRRPRIFAENVRRYRSGRTIRISREVRAGFDGNQ